jgi:peptide/nickel transport system permease protein
VRTIVRRLVQLVVVLVVVTFFASILTALLPGDPVTTIAPFATEEQRDKLREDMGLDENVVVRYVDWLGGFLTGDMGTYYAGANVTGESVYERAKRALPKSLTIMLYVQILTLLVAVPIGVVSAYKAGKRFDDFSNVAAFLMLSIPVFVTAAVLKLFLSLKWGVLPSQGWEDLTTNPTEHFKHLIMPVLAISLGQIAIYSRLLRSDMIATLQEDFILMAKSKGIPDGRVLWRHALRPSSLTLLTVAGLNIGALISGALIAELIFNINGMGFAIFDAIGRRQYVALQSFVAIVAIFYVLVNFFIDFLYTVLDPRIRSARLA